MGQHAAAIHVDLVANRHIVTQDRHVFQACPLADAAVPAYDGALDPGMVLDLGSRQDNAALQTNTIANDYVGANRHIGPYSAVLANLGRGVNHDVAAIDVGLGGGCQELGSLAGQG